VNLPSQMVVPAICQHLPLHTQSHGLTSRHSAEERTQNSSFSKHFERVTETSCTMKIAEFNYDV
jgi:hypothetical protein